MQVELQEQPLVTEEIDEQEQGAANVGYQEGPIPGEKTIEEQWHLRDNVMAAFNTIFQGYKMINTRFMNMSKLIDGNPLHSMGQILNDIQDSVARGCGRQGRGRGS